jgi:ubiquinone/menaquinone biosynthesis C-methylase UbiE
MSCTVCPWWLGYLLINPLRRLTEAPKRILSPFVREGMTVLEPGCGMGFFTLDAARLVGPGGRVIAVDLQHRMLEGLRRRATKAGLAARIDARQVQAIGMGLDDVAGAVDLALAFYMVHEVPDATAFLAELHRALKPGGQLVILEPKHHVTAAAFARTLEAAGRCGFVERERPKLGSGWWALLARS